MNFKLNDMIINVYQKVKNILNYKIYQKNHIIFTFMIVQSKLSQLYNPK